MYEKEMISPRALESIPIPQRPAYQEIEKRIRSVSACVMENVQGDEALDSICDLIERLREQLLLAAVNRALVAKDGAEEARRVEREERTGPTDGEYRPFYSAR